MGQGCTKGSSKYINRLKENGGAGLVNLKKKDQTLKTAWVFKILQMESQKSLAYELLDNPIEDLLWQVNLAPQDVNILFPKDSFWKDVLKYWAQWHYDQPAGGDEILNQILWFNSNIRINGRPCLEKELIQKGVIHIKHLLNEDLTFLSHKKFQERYDVKFPFTKYYGLLQAIPNIWLSTLKDSNSLDWSVEPELLVAKYKPGKQLTKIIYKSLNQWDDLLENYVIKWSGEIPDITYDELVKCVQNVHKVSIYVKLRSFQYRFLLRLIITNIQLYKYKIKDSELCTFCNKEKETLKHLFFDCDSVQVLWNWVQNVCKLSKLTWKEVAILQADANPKQITNLILLLAKNFI